MTIVAEEKKKIGWPTLKSKEDAKFYNKKRREIVREVVAVVKGVRNRLEPGRDYTAEEVASFLDEAVCGALECLDDSGYVVSFKQPVLRASEYVPGPLSEFYYKEINS